MEVRLLNSTETNAIKRTLDHTGLQLSSSSVTGDGFYHISVEPENLMAPRIAQALKKCLGTDKLIVNASYY